MFLEYPLKVLVMVAQVKAGMWKKNGYSVLNQVKMQLNNNWWKQNFTNSLLVRRFLNQTMFWIVSQVRRLMRWSNLGSDCSV